MSPRAESWHILKVKVLSKNSVAALKSEPESVQCLGRWTGTRLGLVEEQLGKLDWSEQSVVFDLSRIEALDTVGALLLQDQATHLREQGKQVSFAGAGERHAELLGMVAAEHESMASAPPAKHPGLLEDVGRHTLAQLAQYADFLRFIGQVTFELLRTLRHPGRIRFGQMVKELELAGLNALPIVGLLSFLIGIVIAYQGGIVLRDYGANIYVADIVGLSTVRELAPLITAIIVAGRTGSAYTAQIGTMMVTEEVDALRSIGVAPMEILVLPKLFALIIALPLLTVFGDIAGILGGLVMSSTLLNLNPATFMNRLGDALTLSSYLSGLSKAPVFAAIIVSVGCFQGFRVFGSAESVGRQTTISVVESIFLVIIVDAAFSIVFSKLGI